MTPPPEFSEPRRSFVKKSLAASVSISFAGLIRAHGEGTTGGTSNPDETTVATTVGGETTTWDPDATTASSTSGNWKLIREVRSFDQQNFTDGPFDTELSCIAAANAKLWGFIARDSAPLSPPSETWGDATGLTEQAPPAFSIGGIGYTPIARSQDSQGKWHYTITIPKLTITVIYWQ